MASRITCLTIVYSTLYLDADQRKHQSSASLAFVRGIHWGPVNSLHKWPVRRKMFPFDDVIMKQTWLCILRHFHWVRPTTDNDILVLVYCFNTLKAIQNYCHFTDNIFQWIFLNENMWILIKISLKSVPRGRINNVPALVQVMASFRPGNKIIIWTNGG